MSFIIIAGIIAILLIMAYLLYYILRKQRPTLSYVTPQLINNSKPEIIVPKNYISIYENEDCTGNQVNVKPGVYSVGPRYAGVQKLPIKENWGKCIKKYGALEYNLYDRANFKTVVSGYGAGGSRPHTKIFSKPYISSMSVFESDADNPASTILRERRAAGL